MNSMTQDETYNGYANRETWAFNLHWQNDQGLCNETLEIARRVLKFNEPSELTDDELGDSVVNYWHDLITEHYAANTIGPNDTLRAMYREVGSWWRIDHAEVGAAVRESLDAESD